MPRKRISATEKQKIVRELQKPANVDSSSPAEVASTVYAEFEIWTSKSRPSWHPVKKMRYIFYRMIGGSTIADALKEIRWNASEFWHLVDLERNAPFRIEYKRARVLQGRAFGDHVVEIAEGRDRTTKRSVKKIKRLIDVAMRRAGKQKSRAAMKMIIEQLLAKIDENDKGTLARNKLQIDAAKWLAKTANPSEFGDKAALALGVPDGNGETKPILIQFVNAKGEVVT